VFLLIDMAHPPSNEKTNDKIPFTHEITAPRWVGRTDHP
jgi:hypothetical protein